MKVTTLFWIVFDDKTLINSFFPLYISYSQQLQKMSSSNDKDENNIILNTQIMLYNGLIVSFLYILAKNHAH